MDEPFPTGMLDDIEDFLTNVHPTLEPSKDFYPEVFRRPLMFPLQRREELAYMMRVARSIGPTTVMEIGSDKGGGLYHWCQCLPTVKKVVGCEIRGIPYGRLFERAFPRIEFDWVPFSSRKHDGTAAYVVRGGRAKDGARVEALIDCLFIDGDKSHFLTDFDAYLPVMADRAVAFMHDVQDPAPGAAFDRVCARGYRTERLVDLTDTNEALSRQRDGVESASPHEDWLRHWHGKSCGLGVIYLG